MGIPFPPEEPFGEDAMRGAEERAEEHVEELRREHAAEHGEAAPEATDRPAADVPWWRRLFRRS